jgi:hypothetical protein
MKEEIVRQTENTKLEPCPFCACDEIVYIKYQTAVGERYKVFCCGCTASIDTGWHTTASQVRELWNKRA